MSTFRGRTHGRPFDLSVQPMHAFVTYTTTHDQTGNRAIGDRPSMNLSPAQQVLKAAVIACSPFTPMLFQGEEWGASTPFAFFSSHENDELQRLTREGRLREFARAGWNPQEVADPSDPATFENSRLDWSEVAAEDHSAILDAYRELFALRRSHPALRTPWAASVTAEFDEDQRCLVLLRSQDEREVGARGNDEFETLALVANFSDAESRVSLDSDFGNAELLHTFGDAAASIINDDAAGPEITLPAWGYAVVSLG